MNSTKKVAAVIGNGPSLRGFDFVKHLQGYATFGMNVAYRYWETINWYPEYYSCLDTVVGLSHKDAILSLIQNRESNGIKGFLLRDNLVKTLGEWGQLPVVHNLDSLIAQRYPWLPEHYITTGSHTCGWAVHLGYRDILLLGIDSCYINYIKESRLVDPTPPTDDNITAVLEITENPSQNPNYFFDGYQLKGDLYHVPNSQPDPARATHLVAWQNIHQALVDNDVLVVNANPASQVDVFPKAQFSDAVRLLQNQRRQKEATEQQPAFDRTQNVSCGETLIVRPFLPEKDGVMVDVGAHFGSSCLPFLQQGWRVYAFEPDEANRATLIKNAGTAPKLTIESRAVSKITGREYPWHRSTVSSGISGMLPFDESHEQVGIVTTVTLRDYFLEQGVTHVDYLKIDAEGTDIMVLQGFPFESIRPACIVCEFEDKKTQLFHRGTLAYMAALLQARGYYVCVSEWHPIVRYGVTHQWRRFAPYPLKTAPLAWGNIVAFAEEPDQQKLRNAVEAALSCGFKA